MKEGLNQLSLYLMKIHAPSLDCDIGGGMDSPNSTYLPSLNFTVNT